MQDGFMLNGESKTFRTTGGVYDFFQEHQTTELGHGVTGSETSWSVRVMSKEFRFGLIYSTNSGILL